MPSDSAALTSWLTREMGAKCVSVLRQARLAGGAIQGNFALDIDVDGGAWHGQHALVLRADAASSVAASLTRAQEFAVLRSVHAAGVLAPEALFLCTDRSVIGSDFFVMRRIAGIASGRELARNDTLVPDRGALAHELGANLARIHALAPPREGLATLAAPAADPAQAAIAQYRDWLDAMDEAHPALEWGLRWCELHAPMPAASTFVHRDYRTGNYLVDAGHLAAVLDWEFAGFGDPREDLGWFTAGCWRFGVAAREAGGVGPLASFLAGYASITGRAITREELHYWQVLAHLRWAVIALQQARRHLALGERSLELALTGRLVPELEHALLRLVDTAANPIGVTVPVA